MKIITFAFLQLFLIPSAFSSTSLFQIVIGNCNTVTYLDGNSNVSGGCDNLDPDLIKKLQEIPPPKELVALIAEIRKLKEETNKLEREISLNSSDNIDYQETLKNKLLSYNEELKNIDKRYEQELKLFEIKIKRDVNSVLNIWAEGEEKKLNMLKDGVEIKIDDLTQLFQDLEKRLSNKINILEKEIEDLNYKLSDMQKVLRGKSDKKLHYFGFSLGSIYVNGEWQPKVGVDYEVVFPELMSLKGVSSFLELTYLDWNEEVEFQTLPGLGFESFDEDNSVVVFSAGFKVTPYIFSKKMHIYTGATLGHSISGEEDTFYSSLIIGVEMYPKTLRLAAEMRLDYYSSIEKHEVGFNAFGDTEITSFEESQSALYLGFKMMLR